MYSVHPITSNKELNFIRDHTSVRVYPNLLISLPGHMHMPKRMGEHYSLLGDFDI